MQTYKAKVASHELLAGTFQYLHLELIDPDRIDYKAGQYVIFAIDPSRGIRRDYSIASTPSVNHAIELLVDVKPKGPGSEFLKNLQAGKEVEFIGPFGSFVVADECLKRTDLAVARSVLNKFNQLLFVATGSGISPVKAMILDLLIAKKYQGQIKLWWGMRNQEDCFWTEDFDELEKDYPNFKWDLVLSSPPSEWPLHSGHVTKHVLDYVQNNQTLTRRAEPLGGAIDHQQSTCYYLCGNKLMIEEVSTKLTELGISKEHIHTEKFF